MEGHAAELQALFAHSGWVRRLARSLVGEQHAADLVQETWVAALEREPLSGAPLRHWTAAVVRNLAQRHWRGEARRTERERATARPAARGDESTLEDLEISQRLFDAVRSLAEPYRTAIHLRYFQDLPPREIAQRLGVPVPTVHTRLHRALDLLRERLDRRHDGDRGAWMALFAPLAKAPNALLAGGWIVQTKSKLALAAVLVLCAGAAWFAAGRGAGIEDSQALAPSGDPVASGAPREAVDASAAVVGDRSALTAPPLAQQPATAAPARVRGIVIGLDDLPLAEQRVVFVDESSHAALAGFECVSDAQGRFDLPHPGRPGALDLAASPFVTVLQPVVLDPPENAELVLVAARRAPLAGMVVDPDGTPIEGAELELVSRNLRSSVLRILDRSRDVRLHTRSGPGGRFAMPDAPRIPDAALHTRCVKFRDGEDALADGSGTDLLIRLERMPRVGRWLSGRVVGADERPVAGARVRWIPITGFPVATTDEKGGFALPWIDELSTAHPSIQAIAAGFLPVVVECFQASPGAAPEWPEPLILKLGTPAQSIRGRVLDADGAPIAGVELRILGQTECGQLRIDDGERRGTYNATLESLMVGPPFLQDRVDLSGDDGAFEIRGLLDQRYSLRCFDPASFAVETIESIPAGTRDLEIRLAQGERYSRIAGRVVDHDGRPVEGAQVNLLRSHAEHGNDGSLLSTEDLIGRRVITDQDGRFEFLDVAHGMTSILAFTPGRELVREFPVEDLTDLEDLRLEIPRLCHVQIDLRGSSLQAESAMILDARGGAPWISVRTAEGTSARSVVQLIEGRSPAFLAADDTAAIVLFGRHPNEQQPTELARIPIHLKPGELNVIRP